MLHDYKRSMFRFSLLGGHAAHATHSIDQHIVLLCYTCGVRVGSKRPITALGGVAAHSVFAVCLVCAEGTRATTYTPTQEHSLITAVVYAVV